MIGSDLVDCGSVKESSNQHQSFVGYQRDVLSLMSNSQMLKRGIYRQITVNKEAVGHNLKHGTNFPTAIVYEHGKPIECHAVKALEETFLSFSTNTQQFPAVFVGTVGEILIYHDRNTPHQSFLAYKANQKPLLKRTKQRLWAGWMGFWRRVPIVSCFVSESDFAPVG